jgi:glucose/arabinose dehydrogenase
MSNIADRQTSPPDLAKAPRRGRLPRLLLVILLMAAILAPLALWAKGKGFKDRFLKAVGLKQVQRKPYAAPRVMNSRPADDGSDVLLDTVISAYLDLPVTSIDTKTLTGRSVLLVRSVDGAAVEAALSTAAGGDRIILKPQSPLEPNTNYTLSITPSLLDTRGTPVAAYTASFTTAARPDPDLKFEQVPLPTAKGFGCTALVIGPDQKLYAGADDGRIIRYTILPDGMLGEGQVISTLQQASGEQRLLIGFCFDPASTPQNPIVWATHGYYAFVDAPDLSGRVTRLSGPDLQTAQDVVLNLPRASKDHVTMQPSIGPDGALYFHSGSTSTYGAADSIWGNRPERMLSAAVLRLDISRIKPGDPPIDALTSDAGGNYDPLAANAPLTIYAYGVRLAYDMVWHSNGSLYAAVNGSSPGGNAPGGKGVPAIDNVTTSEHDWLFRIVAGKYYGHPNPHHGHFVLNGGNPTAGRDIAEIPQYPVGTMPDSNWVPAEFDFGNHISPNGTIEYRSDAFGGKLKGRLIVCRYNGGNDLIALKLDDSGRVQSAEVGLAGWTGLVNPLDLIEDRRNGNIYVSEYGAQKLTLLRPVKGER